MPKDRLFDEDKFRGHLSDIYHGITMKRGNPSATEILMDFIDQAVLRGQMKAVREFAERIRLHEAIWPEDQLQSLRVINMKIGNALIEFDARLESEQKLREVGK